MRSLEQSSGLCPPPSHARAADQRRRRDRTIKKRLVLIAVIGVGAAVAACGGGERASRPAIRGRADLPRSSCRGVDPWKGAALRGCMALVSRWAPVHSVRLTTRLAPRVRSTCEQARRRSRMPVVCPPLIPTGGVVVDPGLYGFEGPTPSDKAGDFYLLTFNNGDNPGHIHWIVGAGLDDTVQRNLFDARNWDVPGHTRRLGERRYGPWTITFYRLPPHPSGGALGGHDLALATVAGTTYFATVHGHTHHDADAAMLIAMLLTARAAP
jgi:hypothetical protein